jgi:hypothetical protein
VEQPCNASVDYRDGRWLCPKVDALSADIDTANQQCVYAPFNCRYRAFDRDSILEVAAAHFKRTGRDLWMYIGGDSRSRGLWLLMVDWLIQDANLTRSRVFKCWGESDFRAEKEHIRLTWRDVRDSSEDPLRSSIVTAENRLDDVRKEFDRSLTWNARRPDYLVMQHGFDVLPRDLVVTSSTTLKRLQVSCVCARTST